MNEPTYLGIEIGGTKLQLAIGNTRGHILDRRRASVARGQSATDIQSQIAQHLPPLIDQWHPAAIGVGFGGPVDWRTGRICCSHQIGGWSGFDLAGWIRSLTDRPVRVDNDANTGALGEARQGAGCDANPVFYVTLGSGVGGGLVANSHIYHGTTPGEAEIGHLRLDREGTIVEQRCSGWAVDQRILAGIRGTPDGILGRLVAGSPGAEARHLPSALAANDPVAHRILNETCEDLAFALSHVTHLFHPEVIILGGGLSLVGEPLRARVNDYLPRFVMEAFSPCPRIALAALGEDAVPMGAFELAKEACR